jgi:hypothetical protein
MTLPTQITEVRKEDISGGSVLSVVNKVEGGHVKLVMRS